MAQDFRDNNLRDDQDLEIPVVNEGGREIHRELASRSNVSLVTEFVEEAWPKPKRAIKARSKNAVTNEIHNGRMIPKPAK